MTLYRETSSDDERWSLDAENAWIAWAKRYGRVIVIGAGFFLVFYLCSIKIDA